MYSASPAKREVIAEQMKKWFETDVIEPSSSPWGFPVVVVYRFGKPRLVVDYHKLNNLTIPDEFPIPRKHGNNGNHLLPWPHLFSKTLKMSRIPFRPLKPAERNYSAMEREALGAKEALVTFQLFIEGESIILVIDHAALQWARVYENANRRLAAWAAVYAAYIPWTPYSTSSGSGTF